MFFTLGCGMKVMKQKLNSTVKLVLKSVVRRSTSFKQHPFLQSVSEHKVNISLFLLFPLLSVTHFLAFTSRSAGLLISRAPTSPVIGSATSFHPGKSPRPWAAPGTMVAAQALIQPWCPVTDNVPHSRSRLKKMSMGS